MMYWGSRFTQTDLTDPATGESLYVWAKVRPRWYWWIQRHMLFAGIVWREWEPGCRIDWWTAWEVALIVHPRRRP